ncbi:MAG: 3-hydroxyacyl-CoA dehydrogenase [Alphaproteobacteria bacterium]|nr:3-hydroxyacyl-CoA dehydrogenase [Alphaproteobacteria bacterium]
MKSVDASDYTLGVVGAGAMGQGIAQVSVQGGMTVLIQDAREGGAAKAKEAIAGRLRRLVEKGRMAEAEAEAAIGRLHPIEKIDGLAPADAVVEAVFEDLGVKQELFKAIEAVVSADCLITSNTSSIPIASIARVCEKRDRIAGLHFFNPVPLMKLVEVIRAAETSDAAVTALTALGKRMTRTPVVVKDSPGFLVNMGGRAFSTEGLRIAQDQIATPSQIDAVMRDCWHFRMGPFELMDLTGMDVNYPVSQIVYDGYMQDPRIKTAPIHKAMFDAGRFGRKTGGGWFDYQGAEAVGKPSPDHDPAGAEPGPVSLVGDDGRLSTFCRDVGLAVIPDDGACPLLAAPIGKEATEVALEAGADAKRMVCIDLLGDTGARVTIMTAPGADPNQRDTVAAGLIAGGRKVTAIKDSAGFIGQRMAAMVANLGCYMAEIGLATPADIDLAMRLGLNYPKGPLELAEQMGVANCHGILAAAQASTGEDRYRPTGWLRRRATLGLPIHTEA